MPITALHHVQLAMPPNGESLARSFYQDLLGIPEVPKPAELSARGCWFENGDVRVHFGVDEEFRPARKAHPAFLVANFAELIARLQGAGCEIKPADLPGSRRVFTFDPFGNRIELIESATAARS